MYFVLEADLREDSALIGEYPGIPFEVSWFRGRRITHEVPTPLVFRLLQDDGTWTSAFWDTGIPLMRADLIKALRDSGVDNIDCYEARIEDPVTGNSFDDYYAVNIVGIVAAADMEQSLYDRTTSSGVVDVDFDSLVINRGKARGPLMFRLAECVTAIVVHEQVRERVDPLHIPGVTFVHPESWLG